MLKLNRLVVLNFYALGSSCLVLYFTNGLFRVLKLKRLVVSRLYAPESSCLALYFTNGFTECFVLGLLRPHGPRPWVFMPHGLLPGALQPCPTCASLGTQGLESAGALIAMAAVSRSPWPPSTRSSRGLSRDWRIQRLGVRRGPSVQRAGVAGNNKLGASEAHMPSSHTTLPLLPAPARRGGQGRAERARNLEVLMGTGLGSNRDAEANRARAACWLVAACRSRGTTGASGHERCYPRPPLLASSLPHPDRRWRREGPRGWLAWMQPGCRRRAV
jgi:hypothetical protein